MAVGLFGICIGGAAVVALLVSLGLKKTQGVKISAGILLGVGILYGAVLAISTLAHARQLANHPLPGTWMCVSVNCPPELTFDDTTWRMDTQLIIQQKPASNRDGLITSGSETCDLTLINDTAFNINCGGNTATFQYQITGDRLTLTFYNNSYEFSRIEP